MIEPTATEIIETLRRTLPEWIDLDKDTDLFRPERGPVNRCGVLMALTFKVNEWMGDKNDHSIRRALEVIDDLLGYAEPVPVGSPPEAYLGNLYNEVWTCFVEGVGDDADHVRLEILPLPMGERIRALFEEELR